MIGIIITIGITGALIYLIILKLYRPWLFIDGKKYNIRGVDENGRTKEEASKQFHSFIKDYENKLNENR